MVDKTTSIMKVIIGGTETFINNVYTYDNVTTNYTMVLSPKVLIKILVN